MPDLARGLRPPRPLLLAADGLWDLAGRERHPDLATWCRAHPRQRCILWVGGTGLADLVCDPGLPLQAGTVRMDWARRVFVHYHGNAAAAWALLPWRLRAAIGVSALHGVDLAGLRAQAASNQVVLTAVRPLWPLLLRQMLAQRPALRSAAVARALVLEPTADPATALLTLMKLQQGRVCAVHRRRLGLPLPDSLHGVLQEDPAARDVPTAAWLQAVPDWPGSGLDVVAATRTPFDTTLVRLPGAAPDFLQPRPRAGRVAWAWLGAALLVLGVAGLDAHAAWQARAQALALPATPPPTLPAAAKAAVNPAALAAQRRVAHPWREVFLASELPAAGGLAWLTLEHQIGGDLRLQGQAPDGEPVQRAAAALRSRPAWRQVLVSRLETAAQGRSFEIVARLAETAP